MLDVSPGSADSGGFLLSGALVVLRRKTGLGAEMLRGRGHGHIHSDFRDNADCGKGLDTRHRHNNVELRKILFRNGKDKRFQIGFTEVEAVHMRTDNAELFSLFNTQFSIHSSKDFLVGDFHAFGTKHGNISNFLCGVFQQTSCDCGSSFAEHIREHIVQFDIGNGETVLRTILFSGREVGELPAITHLVLKLADIRRRNKTPGNQVVLENVRNPLGVLLASNCLDILRVSKDDLTGWFQDIVNGNPVFPRGLHTNILAVVLRQPSGTTAQVAGEGGKPLARVSGNTLAVRSGNAGNKE